jgi:RND family efflux transporter MFP subunit
MIKTLNIILPLLVLAASIIACSNKKHETAAATDDVVIVKQQPVAMVNYSPSLEYSGLIASTSEAKLGFKIAGVIAKIYVKEGDHVSNGQLLATLNMTEINAQVHQASEGVEKAKRDAGRVKNLYEDTVATLEQYQNTQTQLSVANESLRIAQFNQEYAQIRAAGDGTITKKIMNEGEVASSGAPVLIMSGNSNSDWVVRFGVPDKEWAILKQGDAANIDLDAYPATAFTGMITKIAQAADPVSGTYEIEVKVLPGDKKFAPGLFAAIHINTTAQGQVTMIPVEAITEGDGKKGYVYTLNADNKTVTKHLVKIAFLDNDKVAVSNGLENIKQVITDGVSYLTEASVVKCE